MRRTEKNGTVDSVRRTYKLCCYSNTFNCGHSDFACYESTLAVHSENPLMVSNLTTGNSGQLKMSAKFSPSQKRRFWIWPYGTYAWVLGNSWRVDIKSMRLWSWCTHNAICVWQSIMGALLCVWQSVVCKLSNYRHVKMILLLMLTTTPTFKIKTLLHLYPCL